jgi:hypothetical protein
VLARNKSTGPGGIYGEILKQHGGAMIPCLVRLLDITINNEAIPGDWKKNTVIPIHEGRDRSVVTNYRPVSLTSEVCKQLKPVISGYLRQVWDRCEWLYEGQHGFRPRYSCESQIGTVFQDYAYSMDKRVRINATISGFWNAFELVSHDRLITKISASGLDSSLVVWVREFHLGRSQRVRVGGQLSEGVRKWDEDRSG